LTEAFCFQTSLKEFIFQRTEKYSSSEYSAVLFTPRQPLVVFFEDALCSAQQLRIRKTLCVLQCSKLGTGEVVYLRLDEDLDFRKKLFEYAISRYGEET